MAQPAAPNAVSPPTSSLSASSSTTPATSSNGPQKRPIPTPEELISHYESKGLEKNEASMKVIEDLQNVIFRILSSKGGKKDKFMAKSSRMLDTVNTRLNILELKLDSKPNFGQTLGIGVVAGGIGSVIPHVFGAIGQIWSYVRNSTKN
ncbi:hypothetical protein MKX01_036665 [Papaver californicum]|nr:hypothetical protein MKX01_036665 [Papaver californicum]